MVLNPWSGPAGTVVTSLIGAELHQVVESRKSIEKVTIALNVQSHLDGLATFKHIQRKRMTVRTCKSK